MNNSSLSRTLAGIGIIGLGVVATLGSMNIIDAASLWNTWWPAVLIIAGGLMLLAAPRNWGWPALFIVFGAAALVRTLGLNSEFNPFSLFWPAVLIVLGISLLRPKAASVKSSAGDEDIMAMLGGASSRNTSKDYRGGRLTAIMGGVDLDLRDAVIKKQAVVSVTAFWGGVEIKVPNTWVVKNKANAILGGVEVKANNVSKAGAPVLIVTGDVIMGGVEVKY